MTVNQLSTILNNTIIPNNMGANAVTVAEDLSNVVELGTLIANLTGTELDNFAHSFLVGVAKTYFDARKYQGKDYGLMIDSQEFGGVVQRVKAQLLQTEDSEIWTLQNGQNYFDGNYYGINTDDKIYYQDGIWQVKNSIPNEMFKQYFTSAEGVMDLAAMIEATVDNTIDYNIHALSKRVLCQTINNSTAQVQCLTQYLAESGRTLTAAQAVLDADFLKWLGQVIIRLRNRMTEYSKVYNDSTIETFTPEADTNTILLDEIDKKVKFFMQSDVFHNELTNFGAYNTINYWQNPGNTVIPSLGVTAQVKTDNNGTTVTTDNVIGLITDKYTAGITSRLEKVTSQYIANGDYTTYFHHVANKRFVDTRNNSVVLLLS